MTASKRHGELNVIKQVLNQSEYGTTVLVTLFTSWPAANPSLNVLLRSYLLSLQEELLHWFGPSPRPSWRICCFCVTTTLLIKSWGLIPCLKFYNDIIIIYRFAVLTGLISPEGCFSLLLAFVSYYFRY
jgi:hypothetical protein